MIYNKPRKRMDVDRMRRQREKHHDLRYRTIEMGRDDILDMGMEAWDWIKLETLEYFRMEVARWNMWRKAPLSDITLFEDYNLDFNHHRYIFEVRRLRPTK